MAAASSSSWKEQKVAHVSGHEGTTPHELLWVVLVPPVVGTLFYGAFVSSSSSAAAGMDAGVSSPLRHRLLLLLLEVFSFFVPMILCQSSFLYPYGILYLALMAAATPILLSMTGRERGHSIKRRPTATASDDNGTQEPPHNVDSSCSRDWGAAVALYRASLMVPTLIAILAVDFQVFPRRFAKTEAAGYSLMDLGAASFVASSGIVSSRARTRRTSDARARVKWRSRLLPVVFMGALRLVTHRSIDYPEHFTEYGIHWNFMFTLAALQVIAHGVLANGRPNLWMPVAILAAYQWALDAGGLQRWIETAPRTCARPDHGIGNFLVANREGLFGCFSYSCLFLICEWVASRFVWNQDVTSSRMRARNFRMLSLFLLILSLSLEAWGVVTVSRRSTNAWFLLWVLAVNLGALASLHVASEWISQRFRATAYSRRLPPVLDALSRHGFVVFVVANLLTGATNLSTNTLEVSNAGALAILLLYMVVNGILSLLLDALLASKDSPRL